MSGVVVIVCVPTATKENEFMVKHIRTVKIVSPEKSTEASEVSWSLGDETPKNCESEDVSTPIRVPMIKCLKEILDSFKISNAVWSGGEDYVQVVFPLESQKECESILHKFNENGIGKTFDSAVSVLPCCIHYFGHNNNDEDPKSKKNTGYFNQDNTWNRIVSSKNTRLSVDQIVETVRNKAVLTFDFVCLLLISSTMCALGLVENSTVCLLSSMVMSPMMGPVMAATFGNVIRDTHLKKIGVQNELLGLGLATLVGFCYGTIICVLTDKYGNQEWPTFEITSRGELRSLWIGFVIALLSGAAVALGILSDNIASLVGVAISTSLMPPAVNAGLLWSMASVYYIKGNSSATYHSLDFKRQYSDNDFIELLTLGFISICLTAVNIVCIYLSAICIFKVKEVAPIAVLNPQRRQFWKYEIKNARQINTLHEEEGKKIRSILGELSADVKRTYDEGEVPHHFSYVPKNKEKKPMVNTSTWSHSFQKIGNVRDVQFEQPSLVKEKLNELAINIQDHNLTTTSEKSTHKNRRYTKASDKRKKLTSLSVEPSQEPINFEDCNMRSRLISEKSVASIDKDVKLIQTKCKRFLVSSCKENEVLSSSQLRY